MTAGPEGGHQELHSATTGAAQGANQLLYGRPSPLRRLCGQSTAQDEIWARGSGRHPGARNATEAEELRKVLPNYCTDGQALYVGRVANQQRRMRSGGGGQAAHRGARNAIEAEVRAMELALSRTISLPTQLRLGLSLTLHHRPVISCLSHTINFSLSSRRRVPLTTHITGNWSKSCAPPVFLVSKATGNSAIDSSVSTGDLTGLYKKVLLPIIDRNPYLSEATRQAAATTTALAKKYGAEITVVVIDENTKESIDDHDLRIKNIRWHLAQGGFEEFGLLESLGEGKLPAAIIGEIADDLSLDLVVLSMESIHSKHIDGNLLPEFVPCPIMLLPL
ncbi:hypothetical protein GOP47_0003731 [Adiantum capillus-veneris]|uniref:Universal stress protein n=1 Tax=Adiantum capillus-veneris TaxID=13818 RepID=A0A9D4V6I1_ADICA|nr:hypothetical protein GOP47_0003731 [Adiantum capillus-veneris]